MTQIRRRAMAALAGLLAVAVLAGCATTTAGHAVAGSPLGGSPSGFPSVTGLPPASSSSPSTGASTAVTTNPILGGALSKSEFVTQMDAACSALDIARSALPVPQAGQYDVSVIYFQGNIAIYQTYLAEATTLVARSADRVELTTRWVSIDKSDFAAVLPVANKLTDAARAHDGAAVQKYSDELDDLPDHSATVGQFLSGYGLVACAKFETTN